MNGLVEIFTDGSCLGNPGPGGWAALMRCNGVEKSMSGSESGTTNNRMELMAAIRGLEALKRPCSVHLMTDSQYVRQGITQWLAGWKRRGWKRAGNKPVKNSDLWKRLDQARGGHEIEWIWVRGHSGHVENERVDDLAREAAESIRGEG